MSEANEGQADGNGDGIVETIREVIPTSRHATMLFDMVEDSLGDAAVVVTAAEGAVRRLFRRDALGAVIPWALLNLSTKGRLGTIIPLAGPMLEVREEQPRPGKAPALRGLGPGEIEIHSGAQHVTVTYGEDGRWFECARSASIASFAGLLPALARRRAGPVDLLAAWVASLDLECQGPGRLLYPAPLPGGIASAWLVGSWAIRDALFEGRLPAGAGWAVADGYAGTALSAADTREEALRAWRTRVAAQQPVRPPPTPMPEAPQMPDGAEAAVTEILDDAGHCIAFRAVLRGPSADLEWPEPALDNTPAAVIPLHALRTDPHEFGTWTRLLGRYGGTVPMLRREDPAGFTLVGDRLAHVVDFGTLDARLDAVPVHDLPPPLPGREQPAYDSRWETFRLVDETTGKPVDARCDATGWSWGIQGHQLDGDELRWKVLRQRWHGAR